jgi:hypothetical protein
VIETVLPFLLAAGLAVLMGLEWSSRKRVRAWRALRQAPHMLIAQVKDGSIARITGTAGALGTLKTAPIGGAACLGYRLEIGALKGRAQSVVLRREACEPFAIADESGKATVDGPVLFGLDFESDWSELPDDGYALLEAAGVATVGTFFRIHFSFRQALLEPGDRVSACGLAFLEPDPTQPTVGMREPALRPHLRGTTKTDCVAVADAAGVQGPVVA